MAIPAPSWDRAAARDGRYDARFIVGVMSTGIYCLPSCPARVPRPENIRYFRRESQARAAGLRACKRCRPDLFHAGEDTDVALYQALTERVRARPWAVSNVVALAAAAGLGQSRLGQLLRDHAHLTPAAWLRRERVRAACQQLLATDERVVDIGHAVGFESESVFHRQFLALTCMTPGAFRALRGATVFRLELPDGYRAQEVLDYHGRDPQGVSERVHDRRIVKALATTDGALILEIELQPGAAWCRVHAAAPLAVDSMRELHGVALRMLGLLCDVPAFEARATRERSFLPLLNRRRGLRMPLTATPFEALCWAIIGQQINIRFATTLRREFIAMAGEPVEGMFVHPSPERVAAMDAATLHGRRFSRAKASYLIGAATAVAAGKLAPEAFADGSAVAADRALRNLHGVGPWTARYTLMRGAGFADFAPVGDVALAAALHRLHDLQQRPQAPEAESLLQPFAPYRSLATAHLWASLGDAD